MVISITLFLVLYPVAWLLLGSIRKTPFTPEYTLTWYIRIFTDSNLWSRIINTLKITGGAGIISLIIGVPLAWVIARTDCPFRKHFELVTIFPFLTSPLIGAIAWVNLAAPRTGLLNLLYRNIFDPSLNMGPLNIYTLWGIIFVMGLYYSPYVLLFTAGALKSMDPSLEEASRISGVNLLKTSLKITLPLVAPAITSGVLLAMVYAAGQFAIPAILGTPTRTMVLTTTIYQLMNKFPANRSLAAAVGNILIVFTFLLLYLRGKVISKGEFITVTGKGYRPAIIKLGKWKYFALGICLLYSLIAVGLPYFALIYSSLVKFWSPKLSIYRLTFFNYIYLFTEHRITYIALKNSFLLATLGATVCIFLSTVNSYIIVRGKKKAKAMLEYLVMIPAGIPGVVFAVGVLLGWINPPLALYGTLAILFIGYISHFLPVGVRSISSTLIQVHGELEESARIAGSSWIHALFRITIPLIKPGILAGWTTLFIIFLRELGISIFLYSPKSEVVSVMLYEFSEDGDFQKASAMSIVVIAITIFFLLFVRKLTGTEVKGSVSS